MAIVKKYEEQQSQTINEELTKHVIERTGEYCKNDTNEVYYKELLDNMAPFIFTHYHPADARILMANIIKRAKR